MALAPDVISPAATKKKMDERIKKAEPMMWNTINGTLGLRERRAQQQHAAICQAVNQMNKTINTARKQIQKPKRDPRYPFDSSSELQFSGGVVVRLLKPSDAGSSFARVRLGLLIAATKLFGPVDFLKSHRPQAVQDKRKNIQGFDLQICGEYVRSDSTCSENSVCASFLTGD